LGEIEDERSVNADVPRDFDGFVRERSGGLQALAYAYLRDGAEAEDAVQTALLKAWARWAEMQASPRLEAWVTRILRNECIDRWRRQRARLRVQLEAGRSAETRAAEPVPGAGHLERELESARAIITELPEPYRSVLVLRFVEGRSYEAIAETLERPLGTVKSHISRAVKRVRIELLRRDAEGGSL
jgi:RNA polymerase sigma-70 factor, ECF subfamily